MRCASGYFPKSWISFCSCFLFVLASSNSNFLPASLTALQEPLSSGSDSDKLPAHLPTALPHLREILSTSANVYMLFSYRKSSPAAHRKNLEFKSPRSCCWCLLQSLIIVTLTNSGWNYCFRILTELCRNHCALLGTFYIYFLHLLDIFF